MKRIAAPLFGGIVTLFLLELTVYPAILALRKRRESLGAPRGAPGSRGAGVRNETES